MKRNSDFIRLLVEGAFMIALSVILTRFFSFKISFAGVDGVRIGIGTMPIILAGIRSGWQQGARVGALSDLVGYMLSPGGAYMPHFTIVSALYGILPALLLMKKERINPFTIFLSITTVNLLLGMVLTPYFLGVLFGIPYEAIFIPRLFSSVINIGFMSVLMVTLHQRADIFIVKNAGKYRSV